MLKDKAKELLGIGLANNIVASAIGVTESMVSQWLSDETFAQEVSDLRAATAAEAVGRDKKYNKIEDILLEKLEEKLDSGLMFTSPREILAAIRVINSAVRRGSPQEVTGKGQVQIVQLQLPENATFAARFVLNGQNQVIEIAGRSMATMSAKGVVGQLEKMNKAKESSSGVKAEQQDATAAADRLRSLSSLTHLPVAEVL
jgi:hypothetical protein